MTKHLRLAVAAFSAMALLLAGCADDNGDDTADTTETEDVDLDADVETEDDDLLEDDADADADA